MNRECASPNVEQIPGETARKWIRHHHRFAAPSEYAHEIVWDITADAKGPFCTDLDGNVFLDFTSHIGAAPLGYNNPKLMDKFREFSLVDPLKIAGQDLYFAGGDSPTNPEFPGSTQLMERLVDVTSHYGMDTVFLSNSGAEAIENAMKISYANAPAAGYGITFRGAFHGRTLGTLSLTRAKDVYTRRYPEVTETRTVPFCTDRRCTAETCDCGFFFVETSGLADILDPEHGYLDSSEVAYMILEPVQGVGGYRIPSEEFMGEVERIRETYDIPLVVDEIQSGVGRTGKMWASDHFPIEPDVIASAKALRVGATIGRADFFPEQKNRIGSTWGGGDVISSMLGVFTLEAIEEHTLLENATQRGRQMVEFIEDATPPGVVDVRGLGLMLAIEFDTKERRNAVVAEAVKRGLLTTGCGYKTLRLLPPLDVTEREIELGGSLLLESIDAATGSTQEGYVD